MKAWVLALLLLPTAAQAQELVFDASLTRDCRDSAPDAQAMRACIGFSAETCMEASPGGYSTVGMSGCQSLELDLWDVWLNAVYREVRAETQRIDASAPDYAPSETEALKAMQRAWIPYRDAKCDYERSQWGGGTGGGPAAIGCLLHETAEQAIYLYTSRLGG